MGDDHLARLCALQAQVNEMNAEMCAMEAQHAEEVATYQDKIEDLQETIQYQDDMLAYRTEEIDRLEAQTATQQKDLQELMERKIQEDSQRFNAICDFKDRVIQYVQNADT
jgi:chromosome segregation ATPase